MPKILYFDCFSGASGDMILGALLDAGLPLDELRRALGSLAIDELSIEAERVDRAGVAATKFRVREASDGHDHPKDDPHDHPHRSLNEINTLIDRSGLSASAKGRARDLFRRLAEAEAAIHQMPVEQVHLHEVGALDSIVDIVGAVFGLEWLGVDRIVASPMNIGSGTVTCAHGTFPVPAPATTRLLAGVPIYSDGTPAELVTPTGALLVTGHATSFGPLPAMTTTQVGYGAGDRNFPDAPNVLRVLIGETAEAGATERVVVLECQIDDMNPQIFGVLMDRLYEAGALDVLYAPVHMKKNRPGTHVTIVAPPDRREALSEIVFRESTTIGLRYQEVSRERLDRSSVTVETEVGPVRIKVARRHGRVVNTAPEFDDCARIAAARGRPVKDVQAMALKAYLERPGR